MRVWVLSVVAFVSLIGAMRDADACLNIPCTDTLTRVGPANLGVLVFVDRSTPTPTFSLRDAAGEPVAMTITPDGHIQGVYLVRPTAPMTPGTRYDAEYEKCGETKVESLTVPAISPLPAAVGTLQVSKPKMTPGPVTCIPAPETVLSAEVALNVDGSFSNYLRVSSLEWLVDGAPLQNPFPLPSGGIDKTSVKLEADCTGENASFLSPKEHDVELRAWVPGATAPLTARATVDLRCSVADDDRGSYGCTSTRAPTAAPWWLAFLPVALVASRRYRDRRA